MLGRVLLSRARLLVGVVAGVLAWALLSSQMAASTRATLGWDAGVLAFLALSAHLFLTAPPAQMQARAEAQEDGEWTIFAITLGVVIISFFAVGEEFTMIRHAPPGSRGREILLVAITLFVAWLMTHVTFAYRYAHEYYETTGNAGIDRGLEFPGEPQPTTWTSCISLPCWA